MSYDRNFLHDLANHSFLVGRRSGMVLSLPGLKNILVWGERSGVIFGCFWHLE